MGATLRYAKVVDREEFFRAGGHIRPGLDSVIRLDAPAPAHARPFLVLRAWEDVAGAFTESWRLVDPHGRTLRDDVAREVQAGDGDLADEVDDLQVEYADEGFQLVLEIDGREVARADFPVREAAEG